MMELKPSHEVFAQALIVNKGNFTSAYAKAYPNASYHSCRQLGPLLARSAKVKARIRELMVKHDLDLENCIKKLNALTEATKVQTYGKGSCGTFPDHYVRLQAIQTALKIHVLLGDIQPENEADGADI